MANQKKKLNQMKAQRDFDSALQKFSDESEEVDPMRVRGSFYEMNLPKPPEEKFKKAYQSKSPAKKNKKKGNYRLKPITTSKQYTVDAPTPIDDLSPSQFEGSSNRMDS